MRTDYCRLIVRDKRMNVMLADSIDGGILAMLLVCGNLVTAVLALCALVPASHGNRTMTFTLAAPAFVCGLLITLYLIYGYVRDGLHDPDCDLSDFMIPWAVMAGPALVTSLFAAFVLWRKQAKPKG